MFKEADSGWIVPYLGVPSVTRLQLGSLRSSHRLCLEHSYTKPLHFASEKEVRLPVTEKFFFKEKSD